MIRRTAITEILAISFLFSACTGPRPTPYQPLGPGGGFEQTRLQEDVYRVSFRGNRHTPEMDVLDFLYLRCAELTVDAGYTHFDVRESFGSLSFVPELRPQSIMAMRASRYDPFWGYQTTIGFGPAWGTPPFKIDYRLAVFVIGMSRGADENGRKFRMEAGYILRSLAAKKEQSLAPVD